MPFALLVLAGAGQPARPRLGWARLGAAGAFCWWALGMHTVQTAGLALATDLAPPERQPQVVGLMYVMQLIGMIGSALVLGYLLHDYSPGQLIRVVQAVAVTTLVLNVIALWKQEPRSRCANPAHPSSTVFCQAWQLFCQGPTRCAACWAWAWAPWPSPWKTCCSNPMAARFCT
jgi:MFS transporter, BCD family, chlorophyll transporter